MDRNQIPVTCEFEQVGDAETLLGWVISHALPEGLYERMLQEVEELVARAPGAGMSSTIRNRGQIRWAPDPKLHQANFVKYELKAVEAHDPVLVSRHWVFLMDDDGKWILDIHHLTPEQEAAIQWT